MRTITILLLQLLFVQCFSQKRIDQLLIDFSQDHYEYGGVGCNATDSLINQLDIEQLLLLEGNRVRKNCPEFGVYGDNYTRLLVQLQKLKTGNRVGSYNMD